MAKEPAESKLKLIHLFWTILVIFGGICASFGAMKNQQSTNTESVKDKVPSKMFENHQIEQRRSFDRIDEKLDTIIEKL